MRIHTLRLLKPIVFLASEDVDVPWWVRLSRALILAVIGLGLTGASYLIVNRALGMPLNYSAAVGEFTANATQHRTKLGQALPSVTAKAGDGGAAYDYRVAVTIGDPDPMGAVRICEPPFEYCVFGLRYLLGPTWPFFIMTFPVAAQPLINAVEEAARDPGASAKPSDKLIREYRSALSDATRKSLPVMTSGWGGGGANLVFLNKLNGPIQYATVWVFWVLMLLLALRAAYDLVPDLMVRRVSHFDPTNEDEEKSPVVVPWNRESGTPSEMFNLYDRAETDLREAGSVGRRIPLRSPFVEMRKYAHAALVVAQNISEVPSFVEVKGSALLDIRASGLGVARYLIWAIPTIGFVGTVVGIGDAMLLTSELQDRNPVTRAIAQASISASIGVAFDTTLVALMLSLVAMFAFHLLQQQQELGVIRLKDEILSDLATQANAAPFTCEARALVSELHSINVSHEILDRHSAVMADYLRHLPRPSMEARRRHYGGVFALIVVVIAVALAVAWVMIARPTWFGEVFHRIVGN